MKKCINAGSIEGSYCAGIIANHNKGNLLIEEAYNTSNITGGYNCGGIVGSINDQQTINISRAYNYSKLIVGSNSAGIIGILQNSENVVINSCSNLSNGSVETRTNDTSVSSIGGIIGYVTNISGNFQINDCKNKGNISSEGYNIGGIIGYISYLSKLGSSTNCINSGNIKGDHIVGGIIGYTDNLDFIISGCKNSGDVNGIDNDIGGIVGYLGYGITESKSAMINCTNEGKIIAGDKDNPSSKGSMTGGLLGMAYGEKWRFESCSNSGKIISYSTSANNIGGAVGFGYFTEDGINGLGSTVKPECPNTENPICIGQVIGTGYVGGKEVSY